MFRILIVTLFTICSAFSAEGGTIYDKKSSDFEYVITSSNVGKVRYTKPSHSLKSVIIGDKTMIFLPFYCQVPKLVKKK